MSEVFGTKEDLLGLNLRRIGEVEIGGKKWRIRSLTELEKSRFEEDNKAKDGKPNRQAMVDIRCRLIALCVCDADGNPLLSASDIPAIRLMDGEVTEALADAIQKHVGWSKRDVEELAKNSQETVAAAC